MRSILRNGVIYHGTFKSGFNRCSTMVVNNGMIEYLGENPEQRIPDLDEGRDNEQIDLQGRAVFASFIDAHMHLIHFGASLLKTGLDDCKSLDDIRATIAKTAREQPNAKRLLFRGWRQASTNRDALASMIDDIDPRPVYIEADDLHSCWCNSAALKDLGIDRNTPNLDDGTIHRDRDGNPSGLISEGAVISFVWPHLLGSVSRAEKLDYIRAAIREYHKSGYTGVIEMAMDGGQWELLEELRSCGELNIRLAAHWIIVPKGDDADRLAQVDEAIRMHAKYNSHNSPDFRVAGIKLIGDGVVDSCTAALSEPYLVEPGGTGELNWTDESIFKISKKADEAHLQIAIHAIGDAAVNQAVNTLEKLGTSGRRHRIEHLELANPDAAKRLGELGITASMQPVHSDPTILGAWRELVGEERCGWAFAHKDFVDSGAQLAFGTDSPTAPHQPFPNLYVANTRTSSREPHNHSKINNKLCLPMHQVFGAASWGAAYSCFAEDKIGSLEVGKIADFITIDGLSREFTPSELLGASVAETWMNGRRVYSRQ